MADNAATPDAPTAAELAAKVNDLEATVMLLGEDLEAITLAMHAQRKEFEQFRSELTRLREQGLDPLPRPEDDRPPHY